MMHKNNQILLSMLAVGLIIALFVVGVYLLGGFSISDETDVSSRLVCTESEDIKTRAASDIKTDSDEDSSSEALATEIQLIEGYEDDVLCLHIIAAHGVFNLSLSAAEQTVGVFVNAAAKVQYAAPVDLPAADVLEEIVEFRKNQLNEVQSNVPYSE